MVNVAEQGQLCGPGSVGPTEPFPSVQTRIKRPCKEPQTSEV